MADRHVLLIDTDKTFHETLKRALAPYGVNVIMVEDGESGLARVRELAPELVVIAVELPKKDGYGLFSRAKKGAAKSVPIALVTSTVTPDDFAKHKKLSTHADEYIDKRAASAAELVRRIDALINLGPAQHDDVEMLDVDEAEELSEDLQLDEDAGDAGSFPDEATQFQSGMPKMNIDVGIDAETDAAFAALGMDEEPGSFDVEEGPSTAVRPNADLAFAMAGTAPVAPLAAPEPPPPIEEADPPTQMIPPEEAAEMDVDPDLVPDLPVETAAPEEEDAVPEPIAAMPEPEPEPEPEPLPEPVAAAAPANDLDLGLDAVAQDYAAEPVAASVDTDDAARLAELESENARLRRELAEAQKPATIPPGAGGSSREGEFKNLRQMISRKEKELDDLREELEGKDKLIQLGKDKLKESDRKLRDSEERALNLQEDVVNANGQVQTLTHDKDKGLERERGLKARLEASQTEVRKNHDEIDSLKKRAAAEALSTSEALAKEKAEHQRTRDDASARIAALEASHRQAIGEAEEGRVAALSSLQSELDEARMAAIASVEMDRDSRLAAQAAGHQAAVKALRDEHDGVVAGLHAAREDALAQKDRDLRAALAQAAHEREQALAAAEERRLADLAAADEQRKADLATLAEQHRQEKLALEKQHADALVRADGERRQAVADAEQRRAEQLAEADERRVSELAAAAEQHRGEIAAVTASFESEREETKSSFDATVASLNEELAGLQKAIYGAREDIARLEGDLQSRNLVITARDGMISNLEAEVRTRDEKIAAAKRDIEELEAQNAQFQEQVLKAYQKIKNDDAVVQKAKKAMAIALTLLDDGGKTGGGEAKT